MLKYVRLICGILLFLILPSFIFSFSVNQDYNSRDVAGVVWTIVLGIFLISFCEKVPQQEDLPKDFNKSYYETSKTIYKNTNSNFKQYNNGYMVYQGDSNNYDNYEEPIEDTSLQTAATIGAGVALGAMWSKHIIDKRKEETEFMRNWNKKDEDEEQIKYIKLHPHRRH